VTLKTPRFLAPKTLGEHLKQKRQELRLTQKEVGEQLGVSEFTIINWEKGKTEPGVECMPAILQFLGYDPFPAPMTLSERLRAKRRAMGWTIAEAARQIRVDEGTWGQWEQGRLPQHAKQQTALTTLLTSFAAYSSRHPVPSGHRDTAAAIVSGIEEPIGGSK
jgi:transcriptional regulator with XRE-family HTH domain